MHFFYAPQFANQQYVLLGQEAWHCARVLRSKLGEEIHVLDGLGNTYAGKLTAISEQNCSVNVQQITHQPQPENQYLHVAIAPTKQTERMEWFVEKAVELGVNTISFLETARTEKTNIRMERIQKTAISALKQSGGKWLPIIQAPIKFPDFIRQTIQSNSKILPLIAALSPQSKPIRQVAAPPCRAVVCIGPEGDFTPAELNLAEQNEFIFVSLGQTCLRTETAGIAVCCWLHPILTA